MRKLKAILVLGLTVQSLFVAGAQELLCQPVDGQRVLMPSDLFSMQKAPFSDAAEYRNWAKSCLLPQSDYDRGKNLYFIVDVRSSEAYSKFRIEPSINLPVHSIKTKSFLKNKRVLLINEGFDQVAMVRECRNLREKGYANVKILQRGIAGLQKFAQTDHNLKGTEQPYIITSDKLIADQRYEPWVVVDLSSTFSKKLSYYFKTISSINKFPTSEQLNEIIGSRQSETTSEVPPFVVLIDSEGDGYDHFETWHSKLSVELKLGNIFYLQGGIKAFEKYLLKQEAMLGKKEFVLTKPKGCSR